MNEFPRHRDLLLLARGLLGLCHCGAKAIVAHHELARHGGRHTQAALEACRVVPLKIEHPQNFRKPYHQKTAPVPAIAVIILGQLALLNAAGARVARKHMVHDWRCETKHHVLGVRLVFPSDERGLIPGVINKPRKVSLRTLMMCCPSCPIHGDRPSQG